MTYSFEVVIRSVVDGQVKDEVLGEIELSGDLEEMIFDLPDALRALADSVEAETNSSNFSEALAIAKEEFK